MTYRAKKPRKKGLRVKIEKCYYVAIVDETETELEVDYCFGTREDAMQCGQQLRDDYLEAIAAEQKIRERMPVAFGHDSIRSDLLESSNVNPTAGIFWGMNNIGGAK